MPFQPGQSGNPKGRPPKAVEDARQSVLQRLFDEAAEAAVVKAQIRKAKQGDTAAASWLWDRKYGNVKEVVEQQGGLTIRVIRGQRDRDLPSDPSPGTAAGEG
jgi:hypothetical protein